MNLQKYQFGIFDDEIRMPIHLVYLANQEKVYTPIEFETLCAELYARIFKIFKCPIITAFDLVLDQLKRFYNFEEIEVNEYASFLPNREFFGNGYNGDNINSKQILHQLKNIQNA